MTHLDRLAKRISEIAEVCSEVGLPTEASSLDQIADELRRMDAHGVPEHVDPDTTTPVETPLE